MQNNEACSWLWYFCKNARRGKPNATRHFKHHIVKCNDSLFVGSLNNTIEVSKWKELWDSFSYDLVLYKWNWLWLNSVVGCIHSTSLKGKEGNPDYGVRMLNKSTSTQNYGGRQNNVNTSWQNNMQLCDIHTSKTTWESYWCFRLPVLLWFWVALVKICTVCVCLLPWSQ